MKSRPLSLTIIGWFLVVVGGINLIYVPLSFNNPVLRQMMADSPLPYEIHLGIGLLSSIVSMVCGFAVLKGKDWGRTVYVGWSIAGLLLGLFISPFKSMLLIGLLFLAVIAFFLFREPADVYFGKRYFGKSGDRAPLP